MQDFESGVLIVTLVAVGLPMLLQPITRRVMPLVVVQIAVGLLLGPTALKELWPEAYAVIAQSAIVNGTNFVGKLAVILYIFSVGMHLVSGSDDKDDFHQVASSTHSRKIFIVSAVCLFVPLLICLPVGYYFGSQPGFLGEKGTPLTGAVSYAIANSVTALPVLALAMREMGYDRRPVGPIALKSAVFGDGALWCMIAAVLAFQAAAVQGWGSFLTFVVLSVVYGVIMMYVVRPALAKLQPTGERVFLVPILVGVGSALATHHIGLHALLGAVVAGMCMPKHFIRPIESSLGRGIEKYFLPFFFVSTGLATDIPFKSDPSFWILALVSTALAILSKLIPTAIAAERTGLLPRPYAYKLGAFMVSKGLMDIAVLIIFRDEGYISQSTFGALVVMALLSTAASMPLVRFYNYWYKVPAPQPAEQRLSTS